MFLTLRTMDDMLAVIAQSFAGPVKNTTRNEECSSNAVVVAAHARDDAANLRGWDAVDEDGLRRSALLSCRRYVQRQQTSRVNYADASD